MFEAKKGTKCAWCGKPIETGILYQTEIICNECHSRRECNMDWVNSKAYDDWKCTPPDDDDEEYEITVECQCCAVLHEGDEYYEIDGQIWCPECIDDFLSDHKKTVGE